MARAALLCVTLVSLAVIGTSCGDGDNSPTPSDRRSSGSPTGPTCDGDLASAAPLTMVSGGFEVDYLGDRFSLASGDFNDDGFDDALIGAPLADGADDERLNSGEAYVVFGSDPLPASLDADVYDEFVVYGAATQDNLGLSVAAGDVNGDGVDDVITGARFASPAGRTNAGQTYIVFGDQGLAGGIDTAEGAADVTISGIDDGDFSGIVVATGDVTGDEIADVIIGAIGGGGPEDDVRSRAGELYVIAGGDLPRDIDLAQEEPFLRVYGASAEDALPGRIATGDVNGDGRRDIVVGVPQGTPGGNVALAGAGLAYVIEVPEDGGVVDLANDAPLTSVLGARLRDGLGHGLAVALVDGDDKADIIVGARDGDGPRGDRNNAGEVFVLFGDGLPASVDLASVEADVRVTGADRDDSFGFSLTAADVTGDGRADILAGAPLADSCGNSRVEGGEVYLIDADGLSGEVDLLGTDPLLFGAEQEDELGFSVATGDFDGDGELEVIAGALLADGPDNTRPDAGEAYIVEGTGED